MNDFVYEEQKQLIKMWKSKYYEQKEELKRLNNIIKEAREYITSYESISTIQGLDDIDKNKDLDEKTLNEIVRRYLIVHDKLLDILDKGDKE